MIDIKLLRNQPENIIESLKKRNFDINIINNLLEKDTLYRTLLKDLDEKRHIRRTKSELVPKLKAKGEDISEIMMLVKNINEEIKILEEQEQKLQFEMDKELLIIPNMPHDSVPCGKNEEDNVEIKKNGKIKDYDFEPLPHWEITEKHGICDPGRSSKIAGARFALMKDWGAKLERALINFMLDLHTKEHGYVEILPPFMANEESLFASGQLPKFQEDLFKTCTGHYLIPTAEVPLLNLHRDEIIEAEKLPLNYTAYSACFRSEAGAAGKDTRGLTRLHQFSKVELFKFTHPDNSFEEHEKMLLNAEEVLKRLEIPYRVRILCSGDMGFSSAKTYDIEIWSPGQKKYMEISSVSNCTDFQARRAKIRYRDPETKKTNFVHTLNGSGLAIGRTIIAILENYQEKDCSIVIPKALRPYFDQIEVIKPL